MAHARMLEETPTPASGEALEPRQALDLLQSGQVVNCVVGTSDGPAQADGGDGSAAETAVAVELARSLDVPLDYLRKGAQLTGVRASAAEILAIASERGDIVFRFDVPVDGVLPGLPAVVDFTDVSGTYYLAGHVGYVHGSDRPRLLVHVNRARRVQLRRFFRVPMVIAPYLMEVHDVPNLWRPVRGQIIDASLGGLGLLVDEPLAADARLRVEFELPGRFGDLAASGRIVPPPGPAEARARRRRDAGLAYRRGMAFDPLTVEDLRRLQQALYQRQVQLRRLAETPARRGAGVSLESEPVASVGRPSRWKFWTSH
jgi:hypothetical protein